LNRANARTRRQQSSNGKKDYENYDARADAHNVEIILYPSGELK